MAYTNVFGGSTVQPSDVSYESLNLTANYQFSWPQTNQDTDTAIARINDVTTTASLLLAMPDATLVSPGQDALFNNVGSNTFTVTDISGNTLGTVATGQTKYFYLTDNTTQNGTWKVISFGSSASAVDASTLAGAGLKAISVTLNQNYQINSKNSNYTILIGDRATCIQWTAGTGTFSLTAAGTLTNGWFCQIKNSGSGSLTLDPNASETIDGNLTLSLNPQESLILICNGVNFFTVGRGVTTPNTFTRLVKSVAGNTDVTLTATEAANNLIEFTGTLTGNINVNFPSTVDNWYIFNNTNGAFTLTTKTTSGTGVVFPQGTHNIINSDGTNIVFSVNTATGTVTSVATGTGLTGGPITTSGTISVATNGIDGSLFRQSTALTVVGNPSNSTANVSDISFGTDGFVLKRSGTSLTTGLITTANITDANVTYAKIQNASANTVLTNATASSAVIGETALSASQLLGRGSSGNIAAISIATGLAMTGTTLTPLLVQTVRSTDGSLNTGTTSIPFDNTIPQNTEGTQFMTATITPKSSSNILVIEAELNLSLNIAGANIAAIFQDSNVNALCAVAQRSDVSGANERVCIMHFMSAGTTSATTFNIRAGGSAPSTITFNGQAGSPLFGGVMLSQLRISEYSL